MKKYQGVIAACTFCALAAGPAFGQTTGGSGTSPSTSPSLQAPSPERRDGTGTKMPDTAQPGMNRPGAQQDDKSTLGQPKSGTESSGRMGSGSSSMPGTPGSGMASPGMSGMQHNADQVKQIQEALKAQGHDPGTIDGMMGAKTQKALRAYQTAQNLPVTGQIDPQTTEKLGVARTPSR